MLTEFVLNNPFVEKEDLRYAIFKCIEKEYDGIAIPAGLINIARSIYSDYKYTVMCGYPYGIQSAEVKGHEVLENAKHGVKNVDYIINEFYVSNLEIEKITKELMVANSICRDNGISLRAVFESRVCSLARSVRIAQAVEAANINTVILATGNMPGHLSDSIISCHKIKERVDVDVGIYHHSWTETQLDSITKIGCTIARSSSIKNI